MEPTAVIREGAGRMPGFPAMPLPALAALVAFLRTGDGDRAGHDTSAIAMKYRFTGHRKFLDPDGYPAIAPPWGTLSAINLNTGEYAWKIPLGEYPELVAQGMHNIQDSNLSVNRLPLPDPATGRKGPARLFWGNVSRMSTTGPRNAARQARKRRTGLFLLAGSAAFAFYVLTLRAESPSPPASAAQGPPAQGGGRGGRGAAITPRTAYPDRPPGDPAAIERGKALYGVNCQFCHGADTRGGDSGPSLLRSSIVLDDQHGELMAPVIQNGRADRGMPKFAFSREQVSDVAAFIHTFRAAGYDESRLKPPSIIVGDAKAGETFFNAKCAACHSTTGDLRGVATRIADERMLQQTWLMPGSGGGRGGSPAVTLKPVTVTVSLPSGEKIDGTLDRLDDFVVSLTTADGTRRSFRTSGDTPKVDVHDPLQPHRDLLRAYTDTDIHNVTAFLVTLK